MLDGLQRQGALVVLDLDQAQRVGAELGSRLAAVGKRQQAALEVAFELADDDLFLEIEFTLRIEEQTLQPVVFGRVGELQRLTKSEYL